MAYLLTSRNLYSEEMKYQVQRYIMGDSFTRSAKHYKGTRQVPHCRAGSDYPSEATKITPNIWSG